MNAIDKFKKRWKDRNDEPIGSFLVCPDGFVVECMGAPHDQLCRLAKTTLNRFLEAGGVRVFEHRDSGAIESIYPVTIEQIGRLRQSLRGKMLAYLHVSIRGRNESYIGENIGVRQFNQFLNKHKECIQQEMCHV